MSLIYRSVTTQNKEVLHEQTRTSEQVPAFYRGQWRDASDGEFLPQSVLPMEKSWLSVLRLPRRRDDAVREAWKAFETWKKVPTSERAAILNKIADIIDANTEHLAMVESTGQRQTNPRNHGHRHSVKRKALPSTLQAASWPRKAAPIFWMSSSSP